MHGTLRLTFAAALTALMALPALATPVHNDGVGDKGVELAKDPYVVTNNAQLTTGRISGFRTLSGGADAIADGLKPAAAIAPATPVVPEPPAPAPEEEGAEGEGTDEAAPDAPEEGAAEKPAEKPAPPAPTSGDLPVHNPYSAWADVRINDVKVGVIGPYGEGSVHSVKYGAYDVSLTLPNGFEQTRRIATVVP